MTDRETVEQVARAMVSLACEQADPQRYGPDAIGGIAPCITAPVDTIDHWCEPCRQAKAALLLRALLARAEAAERERDELKRQYRRVQDALVAKADELEAHHGLYRKFTIKRTDGRDAPGEKHDGCRYFVLDLDHDALSYPALAAYAKAAEKAGYAALAKDLRKLSRGDERPLAKITPETP